MSRGSLAVGALALVLGCQESPHTTEDRAPEPPPSGPAPGRTVLRRLNQSEYDNTVRDLLGSQSRPARRFPPDQAADGFDTVGIGLSMSLQHLEAYQQAAEALVDELFAKPVLDPDRRRTLSCEPAGSAAETCFRQILSAFADRAFRRPVTPAEVDGLIGVARKVTELTGGDATQGLRAALSAVLIAPQFLFRFELPRDPDSTLPEPLSDHELASRLSYFLWSSMPDDELRARADAGELTGRASAVRESVARMLRDPKSNAFYENFVGQWLRTRSLDSVTFNPAAFPAFDTELRDSATQETYRFVRHLLGEDRPLREFFTADYTFVNSRLAQHYDLDADLSKAEDGFAQVSLRGTERVGILGQASFLMRVSAPDRTSPVKRGALVLDALLCSPMPPPPPDVVTALETPSGGDGTTLRDTLEQHRANPACASCHSLMDPIGLGLENFDAIGAYRTEENGAAIDSSGTFTDGTIFSGAVALADILAADERFVPCLTRKLLTYGVGRPFAISDGAAGTYARELSETLRTGQGFEALVEAVVLSDAFGMQRGAEP